MKIWKTDFDLNTLQARNANTLCDHLDIQFIEIGDDHLVASMPIGPRVKQPMGIMHGGASCVLAETVGSAAANYCVDLNEFYCVGLDINTNHLYPMREGMVFGTAKPFHLGKKTQVWGIDIKNEAGRLVSVSRLTMAVLTR